MVETADHRAAKEFVPGQILKQQDKLRNLLQSHKAAEAVHALDEHLVDVMDFLTVNYPDQALLKFEEVSYLIKQNDVEKVKAFLAKDDIREYARHCDSAAAVTKGYIERASAFFGVS